MISELIGKRLDGNQLKLIAVVSMLIDHTGMLIVGYGILPLAVPDAEAYRMWLGIYFAMRSVGRIAFPVYAYLLMEGYTHTGNWKKYALRLGIFALLSELPFDRMTARQMGNCWQLQNVFFTLLLGLLMMKALDAVRWRGQEKGGLQIGFDSALLLQIGVIGITCGLAWLIRSDYDYIGIMLIAVFYWFRGERGKQCLSGFAWLAWTLWEWYYIAGLAAAFVLIYLYNGRRGRVRWKYGFYLFYPVHMIVLLFIFRLFFGG